MLRILYFQKGIILEERMYDTSVLEEKATVQFLNRFTDYPFLIKWKGHEDRVDHGNPMFAVDVRETILVKRLMDSTSLTLGEAYMKGKLEVEGNLYEALDHFLGQTDRFPVNRLHLRKLPHPSNSRRDQKMGVSFHYDIGNDFYRLQLDEAMNYSCGYFRIENDTLYETQVSKTGYVLKKLTLKEGTSLLDVGCGWGFLLIRAAKECGARGTDITLSTEQYDSFEKRIEEEGLEHLLDVRLTGYGDLPQSDMKSDRMVSVGMVEHVGRESYGRFMDCVDKVLNPDGVFLLHSISSQKEHARDPWVKKYIFPSGVVPSLREIISLMAGHDLHILDVENLRSHYNKTLLCWEKNFKEYGKEIKDMFDGEFVHMWDLYLCSRAATFHNGIINLHQILVNKDVNNGLPMVR